MPKGTETTTEKSIQKSEIKEHTTNWGDLSLWQKFTNLFKGRIERKHYVGGLFAIVFLVAGGSVLVQLLSFEGFLENLLAWILASILIVFPLSLNIRRLHDLGNSGWALLRFFIPIENFILLFDLLFSEGKKEENKYGERPSKKARLFDVLLNRF